MVEDEIVVPVINDEDTTGLNDLEEVVDGFLVILLYKWNGEDFDIIGISSLPYKILVLIEHLTTFRDPLCTNYILNFIQAKTIYGNRFSFTSTTIF